MFVSDKTHQQKLCKNRTIKRRRDIVAIAIDVKFHTV